jgi:hypothetical protein
MSFQCGNFVVEFWWFSQVHLQICFVTYSLIVIKTHFRQRRTLVNGLSFSISRCTNVVELFPANFTEKAFYYLQWHAEVIERKLFQFTHFWNFIFSLHWKCVTFYCSTKCFHCSCLFLVENIFSGQSVIPVYNMSPEVNPERILLCEP